MAASFFHMHSWYWILPGRLKVCGRRPIGGAAHIAQVKERVFTTRFPVLGDHRQCKGFSSVFGRNQRYREGGLRQCRDHGQPRLIFLLAAEPASSALHVPWPFLFRSGAASRPIGLLERWSSPTAPGQQNGQDGCGAAVFGALLKVTSRTGLRAMSDSESEEEGANRQLKFVLLGDGASGKVSPESEEATGPQGRIEGFPNKASAPGVVLRVGGGLPGFFPPGLPGLPRLLEGLAVIAEGTPHLLGGG